MNYAYYRVSTDKQDYENQKYGVLEYCRRQNIKIDKEVIDNGVSGTVEAKKRHLGALLRKLQTGDVLIISELSRLGRSVIDVLNTCRILTKKKVVCYVVKQGITIDDSPMGKMMLAVLAATSELERDLISQRTKEALRKKKADGIHIGRNKGSKNKERKLDRYKTQIIRKLAKGISKMRIAKDCHVSYSCLCNYIKTAQRAEKEV